MNLIMQKNKKKITKWEMATGFQQGLYWKGKAWQINVENLHSLISNWGNAKWDSSNILFILTRLEQMKKSEHMKCWREL